MRISQHLYPFTLYQYLFLTIGLLLRIVSENKCTCTRSCCSYSGIPQRVWASKTRTCGLPSSPASMSPLLVLWIRFPPSPQSSTTSATESSRRSNRKTRSRRPYSKLLQFLLRSYVLALTFMLRRRRWTTSEFHRWRLALFELQLPGEHCYWKTEGTSWRQISVW